MPSNIQDAIQEIILEIPTGKIFDTHFIINQLRKKYSDTYLSFASSIDADDKTFPVHGNIGQEVSRFEGNLVHQQENKSWSENIHGKASECACWLRR
jgi:hypothetical protein